MRHNRSTYICPTVEGTNAVHIQPQNWEVKKIFMCHHGQHMAHAEHESSSYLLELALRAVVGFSNPSPIYNTQHEIDGQPAGI